MNAIRANIVGPLRATSVKRLDSDLPLRQVGWLIRQAGDVVGGIAQRME